MRFPIVIFFSFGILFGWATVPGLYNEESVADTFCTISSSFTSGPKPVATNLRLKLNKPN